jgi:hypothetical protein
MQQTMSHSPILCVDVQTDEAIVYPQIALIFHLGNQLALLTLMREKAFLALLALMAS